MLKRLYAVLRVSCGNCLRGVVQNQGFGVSIIVAVFPLLRGWARPQSTSALPTRLLFFVP